MDSSFDKWLPCDDVSDCDLNYCDEENGIFWGEVTQKEIEFVANLAKRRAINELNASTLDETSVDDNSIDEEVAKNMSFTSTVEPINISQSVSPFVSSIGSSINLFSNENQMEDIYVKPSEEKHLLDQTIDEMPFETRTLFDKSMEVKTQDLFSPFNKCLAKSSVEALNDVAVTRSLVKLDTTTIKPFGQSTPQPKSKIKSKIPNLVGFASPLPPRLTSQRNSSQNDSTLDFILNEIKCNTSENSEEFLTNDEQLV